MGPCLIAISTLSLHSIHIPSITNLINTIHHRDPSPVGPPFNLRSRPPDSRCGVKSIPKRVIPARLSPPCRRKDSGHGVLDVSICVLPRPVISQQPSRVGIRWMESSEWAFLFAFDLACRVRAKRNAVPCLFLEFKLFLCPTSTRGRGTHSLDALSWEIHPLSRMG